MDFSSPFKTNRKGQQESSNQQQIEEQYWKLKAQRVEFHNSELAKEIKSLKNRIAEYEARENEVKDKVDSYQNDWKVRSRKSLEQRNKQNEGKDRISELAQANEQVMNLTKQLRIIKNMHELEASKYLDENRKLKKTIQQIQKRQEGKKNKNNNKICTLQEQNGKLQQVIKSWEEKYVNLKSEKQVLAENYQILGQEYKEFKKEMKLKEKEEEEFLRNYEKYKWLKENSEPKHLKTHKETQNDDLSLQKQVDISFDEQKLNKMRQEKDLLSQQKEQSQKQLNERINKLNKMIKLNLHKHSKQIEKMKENIHYLENQKIKLLIMVRSLEEEGKGAKVEVSNVLSKLAPLLAKRTQWSKAIQSIEMVSSLTMLEIFLKKYKIQTF